MEESNEDAVKTKRSKTLIVRHLPAELNRDEKEDLLKYFGAASVRVLSDKGPLKHTAFAIFSSETLASKALRRLHQLKILGHTLVVEFAKDQDNVVVLKSPKVVDRFDKQDNEEKKEQKNVPLIDNNIASHLGLKFQSNPTLKYFYPPPSSSIVTNITHTLLSVPKFYVQVLHLMNKMNLPCPFGHLTPCPPTFEMIHGLLPSTVPFPPTLPPENPPLPKGDSDEDEESEYESGDDEDKERMIRLMGLVNQQCKRPLRSKAASTRKKPKLKELLFTPKPISHSTSGPALQPSDVFEQPLSLGPKKIELHIPAETPTRVQEIIPNEKAHNSLAESKSDSAEQEERMSGFGMMYPSTQNYIEEESEEQNEIPSEFISRRELEKGRLSRDEIKRMSVFKNYEPGEPTCRLYVKNIAKQVEEKDLRYIYGRYIDLSSEQDKNMFDIVLMKEGRMKGQAFIGLPSEKSAEKALRDTNGYVLHDKPLVVQFARSARPKQDTADSKTGAKKR